MTGGSAAHGTGAGAGRLGGRLIDGATPEIVTTQPRHTQLIISKLRRIFWVGYWKYLCWWYLVLPEEILGGVPGDGAVVPGVLLQAVDGGDVVGGDPAHAAQHGVGLAPLPGLVVRQDSNLEYVEVRKLVFASFVF